VTTGEHAYGPLVALLERRLVAAGVSVPPAGALPHDAERKRALLRLGEAELGPEFATQLGVEAAAQTGHPFVRALVLAPSPSELMRRWCRLEILAHSGNRVRVRELDGGTLRIVRVRVREGGGAPSEHEDRFAVALLGGALEAAGADAVVVEREHGDEVEGRRWCLRWRRWEPRSTPPLLSAIGADADFVRVAFALLLGDGELDLAELARGLALSPRTLQRRLGDTGTSFRALTRAARIARAGDVLIRTAGASLTSVAHACGFADGAHLSREFRELVGMAPTSFVRSIAPSR
jgi:AraC-like DNA-binding protein